ncbi:Cysteine dioxygenase [Penicillium diatomitis]|uniref:Cysteine dioxygenase n=1 Tax=Penicillium diatomitis TaxID=2819901 RepID=A0A9X0C2Y0_9EURO|nr:Cysteine dioxygenase [Penicillium diatomitis]KAJ5496072.1 Cysteine dioxygenase [Penicillium diatomitis]
MKINEGNYHLEERLKDVKEHLGYSGAVSSEEIDLDYLKSLLDKYISYPSDWIQYFHDDLGK